MRRFRLAWAICALTSATAAEIDYLRDIQPVFAKKCIGCHGPGQQMAGLRLDSGAGAVKGSHAGPVVLAGDSAKSKLLERISSAKPGFKMPPAGDAVSATEIAAIKEWIDSGAKPPAGEKVADAAPARSSHWSFQPIQKAAIPAVQQSSWVRNPIDSFVLAKLESEKIAPSPEASKATLLRRLSFDLTGLPPTPEEVDAFLGDKRPDAYERLVDRLLASPHYGEKWARQWLDLARYADSDGYEKDLVRPWAWRYRQWVIDALNADKPFDQFTIEQLAGDLLPRATVDQKIATGFQRTVLTNREAGVDRAEARFEQDVNRTNTVGTVWLGLTVGCSQCHNHKYDPLSQRDYYQLLAYSAGVEENDIDAPLPGEVGPYLRARPEYDKEREKLMAEYGIPELQADWEVQMKKAVEHPGVDLEWDFQVTAFRASYDNATKMLYTDPAARTRLQRQRMTDAFLGNQTPEFKKDKAREQKLKEFKEKLAKLDATLPPFTQAMAIATNTTASKPYIALGGDFRSKGPEVTPGLPTILTTAPLKDRLAMARWLVSSENPLTARVTVNRTWQEFFGRGLVRTSDDFGTQGERPTNPALLDWLASEFRETGWSMKHMDRLIVMSATYRQSSALRKDLTERDPENTLLARQSRLRLPAELIRDNALAASGLLDTDIGGPSIRPPQPAGVAELRYANKEKWVESTGRDRYRRGLYIHFQRTSPYPMLMNFDEPDSNVACTRRSRSNTPLQALNLLNDPVFTEAAQAFALRVLEVDPGERVDRAFQLCLGRNPTARERERLSQFVDQQQTAFKSDDSAAWIAAGRVLMNLDEFIVRE